MKVKSESEVSQSCPTPSDPMACSLPGSSVHGIFQARVLEWGAIAFSNWSLLKLISIESVMPSNHLNPCHLFLLLPSIFPSIRVFSNESVICIRWPKYWSFNFSISPSNGYSGLISFRIDWFDLFAIQGILRSLLQHHQFFGAHPSLQRRQWHPTPVLLPGKSHRWRTLVGCSPWGR